MQIYSVSSSQSNKTNFGTAVLYCDPKVKDLLCNSLSLRRLTKVKELENTIFRSTTYVDKINVVLSEDGKRLRAFFHYNNAVYNPIVEQGRFQSIVGFFRKMRRQAVKLDNKIGNDFKFAKAIDNIYTIK